MSEMQAKFFARSIFSDVKKYIAEHHAEFETWQNEENLHKRGSTNE